MDRWHDTQTKPDSPRGRRNIPEVSRNSRFKAKESNIFPIMQPLHFLSVHLLLPVKEKHSRLSEIQYIYLCIYIKCDSGRSLLPETLDALRPKLYCNQLESFIHSSVASPKTLHEAVNPRASPVCVRKLVNYTLGMAQHEKQSHSYQTDWQAFVPIESFTSSTRINTS